MLLEDDDDEQEEKEDEGETEQAGHEHGGTQETEDAGSRAACNRCRHVMRNASQQRCSSNATDDSMSADYPQNSQRT